MRLTSRTDAKAGLSDLPVLCGRAGTYRIKGTPGITGLLRPSAHSDGAVWHPMSAGLILGLKLVPRVWLFAN